MARLHYGQKAESSQTVEVRIQNKVISKSTKVSEWSRKWRIKIKKMVNLGAQTVSYDWFMPNILNEM